MNYAIIGSREFKDYNMVVAVLDKIPDITLIISGGARGADAMADRYARDKKIKTMIFLAEWDKYGKGAGFIRNKDIVDNADKVIAFWDMKSPGTKNSIDYATKTNKPVLIINTNA